MSWWAESSKKAFKFNGNAKVEIFTRKASVVSFSWKLAEFSWWWARKTRSSDQTTQQRELVNYFQWKTFNWVKLSECNHATGPSHQSRYGVDFFSLNQRRPNQWKLTRRSKNSRIAKKKLFLCSSLRQFNWFAPLSSPRRWLTSPPNHLAHLSFESNLTSLTHPEGREDDEAGLARNVISWRDVSRLNQPWMSCRCNWNSRRAIIRNVVSADAMLRERVPFQFASN